MSEPILNRDELLAPISESKPTGTNYETGEDVELGRAFSELRSLGLSARRIETRRFELLGMRPGARKEVLAATAGNADGPQADPKWERIAELSYDILVKHSKDTRAIVYLIESMIRLYGLPGLAEALDVGADIIEKYGLAVFPEPESPKEPYFALQFFKMLTESDTNSIRTAIYQLEVFPEESSFTWYAHVIANSLEKRSEEERAEYAEAGAVAIDDFNRIVEKIAKIDSFLIFEKQISDSLASATRFDTILSNMSKFTMSLGNLPEYLKQALRWYRNLTGERIEALKALAPKQPDPATVELAESGDLSNIVHREISLSGLSSLESMTIANREQAFENLLRVAAYFRETEPHSPVSYALEQAVRWGRLPLPDLLRDLVADEGVLSSVYRRMGIQDPP
jgi:type VI secretion system protein ImpA